jgi:chromosome segregation protein
MKVRIERMGQTRRNLEREAGRLETRRRSMVSQMAEHLRVLRGLRTQETQLLGEVSSTGSRRQGLEMDVQEIRKSLSKVEANQNSRGGKLEALQARLEVLHDAQKQVEANEPAEGPITLEGALASIYEIIRVPRGMEDAIAAALAEHLEAFVFDRQTDAVTAIESVIAQRGPRTTVLGIDALKQVYPLNVMRERGIVGVATNLIKYPSQYEKLVNALLGRTIVVQNTETAVRLLKRGLGTVVTLDGVLFDPSGSITAGQPQAQASRPFILGFERDMESLPKEIDRVKRSLEVTEREAESLRDRLRQAEKDLTGLNREADEAQEKRLRIQETIAQRQQKLAQLRGELRGLMGSQSGLRDQARTIDEEVERLRQEITQMLAQAKESEQATKYVAKANDVVRQQREDLLQSLNQAAADVARLEGELRSLTAQRETAQALVSRMEAQASAKELQLRGVEMELSAIESSTQSDKAELTDAREQLEEYISQTEPGGQSPHHLEARQKDLHSLVLSSQSRLFEAERHVLEADGEVRRWQSDLDTLRERITDDGLTLTPDGDVLPPDKAGPDIPMWLAAETQADATSEEGPGDIKPISGGAHVDPAALHQDIEKLRGSIRRLGPVNVEAETDYESLRERYDFLSGQIGDLEGAEESLHRAIAELHKVMHKRFQRTFEEVAEAFESYFETFFGGGHAKLSLTDPKDVEHTGVEVEAQPPGKRTKRLSQLSGGEKALTALALLFALLQVNPSPFCVLDEVDAMLDEANVGRFVAALQELAKKTQFVVITHNRRTIEIADAIYGVSMGKDAASRVLSMRLSDVKTQTGRPSGRQTPPSPN